MRLNYLKTTLKAAVCAASVLLFGAGASFAQQQINLSAGPATAIMPDGTAVPMWGYNCGVVATATTTATCAALNPSVVTTAATTAAAAQTTGWSPVVITVPTGQTLNITLTNNLSFTAGTGTNTVPTSLVIVGQLGGGLGTTATSTASPDHSGAQATTTWPIAGGLGVKPPTQGARVQSFSTEVPVGTPATLTWTTPRPGTYLIESGTHPSIQGPMGLYGILVVTTAPAAGAVGTAYPAVGTTTPAVTYSADVPLLLSEIDPVQNKAVNTAVTTAGFSETKVWSGQPGGCGNPGSGVGVINTCYPPAVNYTPLYYMINGAAFNKTNPTASVFPATPLTGVTGNVLVRFVNAGLRMHVPSIVGSVSALVGSATTAPSGFSLIAEDGNPLPGIPRIQNEVFMAAGKTYDVMINTPAGGTALPVYDRELSLSGNAIARDAGMLAYISVNGTIAPAANGNGAAFAKDDIYNSVIPGAAFTVSDPSLGLIANDTNVYGVQVLLPPTAGTLALNADGTFTYTANAGTTSDLFTYCANGAVTAGPTCTGGISAKVTLGAAPIEAGSGITMNPITYTSKVATFLKIASPGILSVDKDAAGYPLTVNAASVAPIAGLTLSVDKSGGFVASVAAPGTYTFAYKAQNSQGTPSATTATVTLVFPQPSGLAVTVLDGATKAPLASPQDYRWIIEEDRTFYVDPTKTTNTCALGAACPIVPTFGTNFHTSFMPVVATGCTGPVSCESGQKLLGVNAVCDGGNGVCRTTATQETPVLPSQVALDPSKRYYISVLPGDAATPFETGNLSPGHGMGGAPIPPACTPVGTATTCTGGTFAPVTVLAIATPLPPSKLSVFVYEDDFPLNGEQDGGGGIDVLSPNEPGLGQFNITIMDDAGGPGDPTGQVDYDMFNQPLSNSLAGTIDPSTGADACPIGKNSRIGLNDPNQTGITGTIVTCPKLEGDQKTLSPLAGQAVVANMMPGRYGIIATPGADRIAKGEEWLQTNTLDGQKAHDSFLRVGEPSFFQEFGPAGYHVSIGFANPKIINGRKAGVCAGKDIYVTGSNCTNTVTGTVTTERMSRTPDERLYSSGDNSSFGFTQCYVSFGDPDGEDFAFTKCAADGTFTLSGLPDGDWRVTVFDQWNDMLVDGLSTPVRLAGGASVSLGQIAINQWQANIYTRTFFDTNNDGVSQAAEPGLALVKTNVRFRDGSFSNRNNTDLNGVANFNEEFPLFSWYVVETDVTRYKNTGTHVVYDAGGPADGSLTAAGVAVCNPAGPTFCGASVIGLDKANTLEQIPVPANLRVPGAVYCDTADCTGLSIATGPVIGGSSGPGGSTGRIDPPWVLTEAWQGFSGQNNFLEFGKKPYAVGENGGIRGHVIYSSTRPFDDPQFGTQNVWEPLVPGVTINLYREGTAADGSTSLTLIDSTKTSSWDDWAQGFRTDGIPNMNCPGQGTNTGTNADLFFFSLYNQPNYLDVYNNVLHGTSATPTALPANSQFKCYDGMHNWNQLQPAPYDGMYQFPSVLSLNPATGKPVGTNCTGCIPNPDTSDPYRTGTPMLPVGKYVTEVVVPPGYVLVKEEDKNILIGDNFIAPVTVQFPGLGSAIFIVPDQAAVGSTYNANSAQNPTQSLGRNQNLTSHEGDTPTVDTFWPCVGETRIVPDYISLFPGSLEVAPFAGASRNLCDRKEVTLDDQTSSQAEFFIFTPTHAAAHFTGVITDDFTSEFDPFSPQFGEKFAPADLPVSFKDWQGNEISRVYADQWGSYDGLTYSTWEVNPPNPTGYSPTMMVVCMNDQGTGATPDPLYNPQYSNFCYEIPFMPGQTQYMDTPVTPVSAFAGAGYNNPDCAYPDATPAISEVDGDGIGPWVSKVGNIITITSLGIVQVPNNEYSGPQATTAPYNQKTVARNYGFGTAPGHVSIGGQDASLASGSSWSNTVLRVQVPDSVPLCAVQQQVQYGGPAASAPARCGELKITAANGKQSIDTVTVTIGGKAPAHVAASGSIQSAIDAALPGDLIIVDPTCKATVATPTSVPPVAVGQAVACSSTANVPSKSTSSHSELLLMWQPVRLQGVGAASSIINANTHPAGKMDAWRAKVNCLFGLGLNGSPTTWNSGCGTGLNTTSFKPTAINPQVDRIPTEATVGWDASLNGNLAEMLQEPSLMGALEGAGITVLSKGVNFPTSPWVTIGATFPTGTSLLTGTVSANGTSATGDANPLCHTSTSNTTNPFPSNYQCNPSAIDGLTVTNSSQGGGGIFVHAWGHNLQISNNRVISNTGTLSGGINVGQGEFPPAYLGGAANAAVNGAPGSCETIAVTGVQEPYCFDLNVNVHNNSVTSNSSTGDELFSATPAGAGGVSFCTGSDYYDFDYNWVCGNLSTGDGGGLGHLGFIYKGEIGHNSVLFNQSTNPTIASNGGGILIMGAPDVDPNCSALNDADCVDPLPPAGQVPSIGPSDGAGPGLVINANLIMGNAAESGSGGGLRLQNVNGSEVVAFPTHPDPVTTGPAAGRFPGWHAIQITNNIIANNVAGWDGAGVSLLDALKVSFINNTIISNDTTASSGVLFNTLGAPLASSSGPTCTVNCGTSSLPQPAGLVSIQNSAVLSANLAASPAPGVICPAGYYAGTTATNGTCTAASYPIMDNNVFWQNRAFYIGVGTLGAGTLNQQHVVALYNAFSNPAVRATTQPQAPATAANGGGTIITGGTGACVPASYWDIGVRGDTGPSNHASLVTLAPQYSVLTDAADYPGAHNTGSNPTVVSQYCNGSRVPPELGTMGYNVPPGISDATVPNPVFALTPAATVDEGNNWINISWGPLAQTGPNTPAGLTLGNYAPAAGSPVIGYIPSTAGVAYTLAPATDFFNRQRKTDNFVDAGAVEFVAGPPPPTFTATVTPTPLAFGNWATGTTSNSRTLTVTNTGTGALAGGTFTFSAATPFTRAAAGGTCGATLAVGATCTYNVVFTPATAAAFSNTLTVAYTGATVTNSPVTLTGTGVAARATVSITPNPLTITLPATGAGSLTGTGVVTLTNTAPAGGAQLNITNVVVAGGSLTTYVFNDAILVAPDTCIGATLAPGGTCTLTVRFTNTRSPRGVNRAGTVTFTDNGAATPQVGALIGHAN